MAYLDIHKLLTQSVIDGGFGLPIAHENMDFDPEAVSEYISINVLYDEQNTVTKTDLDDVKGFLQISHYVKSGQSVGAMYEIADKINAFYPHAKQFIAGPTLNIQNIAVNKRNNNDGWYITDFTIYFWVDISR